MTSVEAWPAQWRPGWSRLLLPHQGGAAVGAPLASHVSFLTRPQTEVSKPQQSLRLQVAHFRTSQDGPSAGQWHSGDPGDAPPTQPGRREQAHLHPGRCWRLCFRLQTKAEGQLPGLGPDSGRSSPPSAGRQGGCWVHHTPRRSIAGQRRSKQNSSSRMLHDHHGSACFGRCAGGGQTSAELLNPTRKGQECEHDCMSTRRWEQPGFCS